MSFYYCLIFYLAYLCILLFMHIKCSDLGIKKGIFEKIPLFVISYKNGILVLQNMIALLQLDFHL